MCIVSNIGRDWTQDFPNRFPWATPGIYPPYSSGGAPEPDLSKYATKEEIEALRKEMKELKKLLKAAKRYDEKTGQPDCEVEEKVELIKKIADLVGVDMSKVLG